MPRYIDADALKDVIQQHDYPLADKLNSIDNGMFTLGIFQAIDQMPTISFEEARGVGKWISVEKRLPEENKNYLCYGVFLPLGVKAMDMYRFDGVRWRTSSDVEITHWMPLPEPPKEDAE